MIRFNEERAVELFMGLRNTLCFNKREQIVADMEVFREIRGHYEEQLLCAENRVVELQGSSAILSSLDRIEKLLSPTMLSGNVDRSDHHQKLPILTFVKGQKITLAALRQAHEEAGIKGRCIVKFDPTLLIDVIDVPGFRHIDNYKYTKPVDSDEIGGCEAFHFVLSSPMSYLGLEVW